MQRSVQILLAAVAAASGVAAADQPLVTKLFLPYNDPSDFVATVLGVDKDATTFAYTCASSVDAQDCGMDTYGTVVQGPSTWRFTLSHSDAEDGLYAMTAACALTESKDLADCEVTATESDTETVLTSSTKGFTNDYVSMLQPVTVVAGLEKLTGGAAASTTTAPSTTATGTGATTAKSTGDASKSSEAGGSETSSKAGASSTTNSNAAPAATQQAVLAGLAAVVGALAM